MTRLKLTNYSAIAVLIAGGVLVACERDTAGAGTNNNSSGDGDGDNASGGTAASTGGQGGASTGQFQPPNTGGTSTGGSMTEPMGPRECLGMGTGDEPLIDDLDDEETIDKFVPANEGRNGWWEAFDDEEGTFTGKIDFSTGEGEGVDGSNARCVGLEGFSTWGAVIAVNMGFPRCMYDASEYDGICFDAKGEITQGDNLEFSLNTADTLGTEDGGRCDETDGDDNCVKFSHYKTLMRDEDATPEEGEVLLSPNEYRTFCFTWDELVQDEDAATPRPQNIEEVVQFEWKWPSGTEEDEFDSTDGNLCLDNVRFMTGPDGMGGSTQ